MDNKETNKFRDTFNNMLNNEPEVLKEFINLTFEEYNESQDFNELLCSLKYITLAKGGIELLSKKTGLSRQTIHNMFKKDSNPKLNTFFSVLNALDLDIKLELKKKPYQKQNTGAIQIANIN